MKFTFLKPLEGKIFDVTKTPDKIFSEHLLGPGFVIFPTDNKVYAPVSGRIELIFNTLHALVISMDNGLNLLIHIGLNTGVLFGEGFCCLVKKDDYVNSGDLLLTFKEEMLQDENIDLSSMFVFLEAKSLNVIKDEDKFLEIEVSK